MRSETVYGDRVKRATDVALLHAWRAGDRLAGEGLFERYYLPVTRFFANKVSDGSDEDLVQQTFKECVEGRDRLRDATSIRSYIFGIAHNLLRAHLRQLRRQGEHIDFERCSVHDLAPGPSTMEQQRSEHRQVLEALRRIPVELQVVIELRWWEEMQTAEIAEVLQIPHPTARGRLRRARLRLREELERQTRDLGERTDTAELLGVIRSIRAKADALRAANDCPKSAAGG